MITADNVKKFAIVRKEMARKFNSTEKTVQRAIDSLFDFAMSNTNSILTPDLIIQIASDTSSILHDVFDWENEEIRTAQAKQLLDNISYFITTDGRMYKVTKAGV